MSRRSLDSCPCSPRMSIKRLFIAVPSLIWSLTIGILGHSDDDPGQQTLVSPVEIYQLHIQRRSGHSVHFDDLRIQRIRINSSHRRNFDFTVWIRPENKVLWSHGWGLRHADALATPPTTKCHSLRSSLSIW